MTRPHRHRAASARHLPTRAPLTARSVVLSTLLGYYPPELPLSSLVRVGALFGMGEKAVRVALTRMVADGDLVVEQGVYSLTERLVERQARQEESGSPKTQPWSGLWEMAVVTAPPRPLSDRVALRKNMFALRLAELREGVWTRPANLSREPAGPVMEQCTFFVSCPEGEAANLARSLWDLEGWAGEAHRLRRELDRCDGLAAGFLAIADVVRHLFLDPLLPEELLPAGWPADDLRRRYREFTAAYAESLRAFSQADR